MRLSLLTPNGGTTRLRRDPAFLVDTLSLVGVVVTAEVVALWTYLERLLAYDWAIREHRAAGDAFITRREKPHFVTAASWQGEVRDAG